MYMMTVSTWCKMELYFLIILLSINKYKRCIDYSEILEQD